MSFIFTWIIKVFCYLFAIPFDMALNSLGQIFSMDGTAFLAVFGNSALSYYTDLFMPLAYALLFGLALFSVVKGVIIDKNEMTLDAPLQLLVRLGICFFLTHNALPILQLIRSVFSVAYDWIALELSTHDTIKMQIEQVGNAISDHLFTNNYMNFNDVLDMSGLASGVVGLLFSTFFLIPVYFRIIKVMITFASRYVLRCVLELVSPLPFACGVSKSTSNILSNFMRLYIGVLVSTIISAFLLKLYWAGAALISYNMIHSVSRGVLTMFLVMGMYEVFMKVDTYINQIGLHGMAPGADRRATLGNIMQTLFVGSALHKYLKRSGLTSPFGGGFRTSPKQMSPGAIGGNTYKGLPMKMMEKGHGGASTKTQTSSKMASGSVMRGPAMTVSKAASILNSDYMRSGRSAGLAFRTLMPGVSMASSQMQKAGPGRFKGSLIGNEGFKPLALRKNEQTGAWEGAPISMDGGVSEVSGSDYRPMSELVSEYGATAVSIGDGERGMQFSINPGETFSTSLCDAGFDKFAKMQSGIDPYAQTQGDTGYANTAIETTAFGENGHIMATKVGNNSMQGYYYSPSIGHVEGIKASVISKEEYDHNPARAVKLNNGMYLRFHKSDPDSLISKAAKSVIYENGRFVRKGKFTLNEDGTLKKKE